MYESKLNKYIRYFKVYTIVYLIIFLCSLFYISYLKSLIIFYNISVMGYMFFISQKVFFEQDKFIEKNYKDIYKRYDFVCVRPIAITFRELTSNDGFLPIEIKDLLIETRTMLGSFVKIFLLLCANTLLGGFLYMIIVR